MLKKPKSIQYTSFFVKQYRKLPTHIQQLAIKKEELFKQNIIEPSLRTHKLQGQLEGYFAFSINREYRIMFTIEKYGVVVFIDVGTHQIYR